jgi:hypothetical protein
MFEMDSFFDNATARLSASSVGTGGGLPDLLLAALMSPTSPPRATGFRVGSDDEPA